ncbi:MAG TPA: aldose 1-epimerase, partial [Chloroflexota bacterium]|nr:aldose 1-epimerase [Chloroflexota bacterium]
MTPSIDRRRYTIEPQPAAPELYLLRDHATGAAVRLWVGHGNNAVEASLPGPRGEPVTAILAPEHLEAVREQPSWWGIPLLFPWPGRIPGGVYEFDGRRFQLPDLDAGGNASHGFARHRPWRVERTTATDDHAAVTSSFSSAEHPQTLQGYPFPYRVTASYRLDARGLSLHVTVRNEGSAPMPFGFGAHPYFRVPIAARSRREACLVTVPAARRWDLPRLAALGSPGGPGHLSRAEVTAPVAGADDL